MESSTEILRRMLDERGVEWKAFDDFEQTTQWSTHNGAFVYWARERDGKLFVETTAPTKCSASCTPEQAIAATLGRGECHKLPASGEKTCIVRHNSTHLTMEFGYWRCSECGCECFEGARYCMGCGARVVDA